MSEVTSPKLTRALRYSVLTLSFLALGAWRVLSQGGGPLTTRLLEIQGSQNEPLVIVDLDGTITYGPDYKPDVAAQIFWQAMATLPTGLTEAKAEIGRLKRELERCQHGRDN